MKRSAILVGILGVLIPFLACFHAVLFSGKQFAYRDAAHFYYPLYKLVQNEWSAGRWPLWEVEENSGMPLLGNPTAAVLYPGKLIYACLPYAWGARLYAIAHVLLALAGMVALLRNWEVSWTGSLIGGLSFAFAGPIVFQYCNIIFLVGAAWAPLGFRGADRWLRLGKGWGVIELALAIAMQTLGGDPQIAYLTGVCAGGYALALVLRHETTSGSGVWRLLLGVFCLALAVTLPLALGYTLRALAPRDRGSLIGAAPILLKAAVVLIWLTVGIFVVVRARARKGVLRLAWGMSGLAAAAVLAGLLAAAQLLPVLEYTSATSRAAEGGPHEIYPFSLSPYRLAEFALPHIYGKMMGTNRHWLSHLPPTGDHRIWVPSLYMSGLACVLALSAIGFRGGPAWRAWLTSILLLSLVASFGTYASPVWWARETQMGVEFLGPHDPVDRAFRSDGLFPDGDASLYGILARLLPGFQQFRYPSKLLTLACLALAGLAGLGWDELAAGRTGRFRVVCAFLFVVSIVGLGLSPFLRDRFIDFFQARDSQGRARGIVSGFGPFVASDAFLIVQQSLGIGTCVYASAMFLSFIAVRARGLAAGFAIVLLGFDLAIADADLVITTDQSVFEAKPKALAEIERYEQSNPSNGPYRIFRMHAWEPVEWMNLSSSRRCQEFVSWEHDTLQPKYGLLDGVCYTATRGTAELYDYDWFFGPFMMTIDPKIAESLEKATWGQKVAGRQIACYPRRGFDLWNTRYFLLPMLGGGWVDERRGYASFLPNTQAVHPTKEAIAGMETNDLKRMIIKEDFQILLNNDAYPRAWVVHSATVIPPVPGLSREERNTPMTTLLYQDDGLWSDPKLTEFDSRHKAIVESDDRSIENKLPGGLGSPAETVVVKVPNPQRVELVAKLNKPGIVVLADVFYPGWKLEVDGKPAEILRVNRMMRGAFVGSGQHRLVYWYDPESFRRGRVLSLAGLAVLVVAVAGLTVSRRNRPK